MAEPFLPHMKEWFSAPPEQQKAAITQNFKNLFSNDKAYLEASPERQAEYQKAHTQVMESTAYNSEFNPSNKEALAAQTAADSNGVLGNFGTQIKDSHKNLGSRLNIYQQILRGNANSPAVAKQITTHFEKQKAEIQTIGEKELAARLKLGFDQWEQPGFLNKAGAIAKIAGAVVAEPIGTMDIAAKSSSSITSMLSGAAAGSKIGGLLGSIIGPEGAIAGALWGGRSGALAAETVDAASAKFIELLGDKLEAQQLDPTESNVTALLADKEWLADAQHKAVVYGGSLSVADQLTAGMVTKAATLPKQMAKNAARASLTEAQHAGIVTAAQLSGKTVAAETDAIVNRMAAATIAAQSFKSKLGIKGAEYVAEVASEPISEAIGTASIGEKNTLENLTYETIGGIGTGPFNVALNNALYGTSLIKDKAVNTAKDVLTSTPETRLATEERKAVLADITKLAQTEAGLKYADTIAAIDPEGEEFKNIANPHHENFNPIAALDVIAKVNDPTAQTQAVDIIQGFLPKVDEATANFKTLLTQLTQVDPTTGKKYEPTTQELKKLESLKEIVDGYTDIEKKLFKKFDVIKTKVDIETQTEPVPIDVTKDKPEDIIVKLGSHGTSSKKDNITVEQIEQLESRSDIVNTDIAKELNILKTAKIARQAIEERQIKSQDEVTNDIYHGMRGMQFKGIDAYQEGIKYFLNPKASNPTKAAAELDGLRKFSTVMKEKADVATAVFESMQNDKSYAPTAEQQAVLDKHGLDIHYVKSKNLVPQIQSEANALQNEVKLAEATYKRLSPSTYTTTSTATQMAPAAPISKPTVAPATVNTPVQVKSTPVTQTNTPATVVTTKPVTKPVVESKPTTDVTQPSIPSMASRLNKLIEDTNSNNTSTDGLAEFRAIYAEAKNNGATEAQLIRIQKYSTAYAEKHNVKTNPPDHYAAAIELLKDPARHNTISVTSIERALNIDTKTARSIHGQLFNNGIIDNNGKGIKTKLNEITSVTTPTAASNTEAIVVPAPDKTVAPTERKEALRLKQEVFVPYEDPAITQEQMDDYHEYADDNMEDGNDPETIRRILEELAQEDAAREARGVSTDDGRKSSADVGEIRGETAGEIAVDNFAEYDIDPDTLMITYTDAFGVEQTKTYDEAKAEYDQQVKDAEAVMKCVQSK